MQDNFKCAFWNAGAMATVLFLNPRFPSLSETQTKGLAWGVLVVFVFGTGRFMLDLARQRHPRTTADDIFTGGIRLIGLFVLMLFALAALSGHNFVPAHLPEAKIPFMTGAALELALYFGAFRQVPFC